MPLTEINHAILYTQNPLTQTERDALTRDMQNLYKRRDDEHAAIEQARQRGPRTPTPVDKK